MNCDEAKLKIQALADGELAESDIPDALEHVQSCYNCREEYISLLQLQKKLKGLIQHEPSAEWFEKLNRRITRKIGSSAGQILFIGSYLALIAYAVYSLFADTGAAVRANRLTASTMVVIITKNRFIVRSSCFYYPSVSCLSTSSTLILFSSGITSFLLQTILVPLTSSPETLISLTLLPVDNLHV